MNFIENNVYMKSSKTNNEITIREFKNKYVDSENYAVFEDDKVTFYKNGKNVKEINDVYKLVNILVGFDGDVDLESGRYKVDGKSILGIFSLDLSKAIDLTIHGDGDIDAILTVLKKYEV